MDVTREKRKEKVCVTKMVLMIHDLEDRKHEEEKEGEEGRERKNICDYSEYLFVAA